MYLVIMIYYHLTYRYRVIKRSYCNIWRIFLPKIFMFDRNYKACQQDIFGAKLKVSTERNVGKKLCVCDRRIGFKSALPCY